MPPNGIPPAGYDHARRGHDNGIRTLRSWLGLDVDAQDDHAPLRALIDTLEHLEPDRARHLARFAYLLGRVAHADRHVSPDENT